MSTDTLTGLSAGTWTIDPTHTEVGFVARHLMVSKVRGSFTDVSGTVVVGENLADSTAEVTIGTGSVSTGTPDRDAHLRGGDFFDVDNHPHMTFRSTSFDGTTLTGDLTIKGVTKPVTLEVDFGGVATDPWGNEKAAFEAEGEIDRTDWGLTWNAPLEKGGVLVSEKVKVVIDLQLAKQA
ncbi:polyisoprenoid-binding protein [Phycicoccus endophyticus]|uniref:Polyisoprenoid-binding protein n=1 Tax=Phycicoccus endophyticus TaxID=1690220 RepID=A0A7G9QZJ7_9MICO|nr:YceI family protein [Phycicoccus endophyticus]NHI19138.1 YceI family protein [Phycicoccus endophyticus]QNN48772.1 polyisoprenoid-binding protein [Phycicoccus endophyticus]GGL33038.1 polyisoprenoid-binding protein [Phycicoccus endophyticus]